MFVRLPNVPNVEHNLPVRSRLNPFLGTLEALGAVPKTNMIRSPKIHQPMDQMQSSQFKISGILQLTFLGSKTTQSLETYSRSGQGEWVTSVDFKDTYFHIPIQELVNNVSATGLADELREIRAGAQTRLPFCRLPVRPQV